MQMSQHSRIFSWQRCGWRACDPSCRHVPHLRLLAVRNTDTHSVFHAGQTFRRVSPKATATSDRWTAFRVVLWTGASGRMFGRSWIHPESAPAPVAAIVPGTGQSTLGALQCARPRLLPRIKLRQAEPSLRRHTPHNCLSPACSSPGPPGAKPGDRQVLVLGSHRMARRLRRHRARIAPAAVQVDIRRWVNAPRKP
jgi:hypothetical protein